MHQFFLDETDPEVEQLRRRLDIFYNSTTEYLAFQAPSDHPEIWGFIRKVVQALVEHEGACRALEIGAGRSGFSEVLKDLRPNVHYVAQDITSTNRLYLQERADEVVIQDVMDMTGVFNVIFSSFTLEHITNPQAVLEKCWSMLAPGGSLFIFCPRYDFPFYLPPSLRHHGLAVRFALSVWMLFRRLITYLTGNPAFLIVSDPSMFHLPWAPDRDAIHVVSLFDIRALFAGRGQFTAYRRKAPGVMDQFCKNFLQINIRITKRG